jgi:hypothetical protein
LRGGQSPWGFDEGAAVVVIGPRTKGALNDDPEVFSAR